MIWVVRTFNGAVLGVYNNGSAAELHRGDVPHAYISEHEIRDDYHPPEPKQPEE